MKRRSFIKNVIAGAGIITIFPAIVGIKKYWKLEEVFDNKRYYNNEDQYHLTDSPFHTRLYSGIQDKIYLERDCNFPWYYFGEHDITLPMKPRYTANEINEFLDQYIRQVHKEYGAIVSFGKADPVNFMHYDRYVDTPDKWCLTPNTQKVFPGDLERWKIRNNLLTSNKTV